MYVFLANTTDINMYTWKKEQHDLKKKYLEKYYDHNNKFPLVFKTVNVVCWGSAAARFFIGTCK